jgi:chemotaxis protein CheD
VVDPESVRIHTLSAGEYMVLNSSTGNFEGTLETGPISSGLVAFVMSMKQQQAGMVHMVLPDSRLDQHKARQKPGYFVDTGLTVLLDTCGWNGQYTVPIDLEIKLVGAAKPLTTDAILDIGSQNLARVQELLEEYGFFCSSQDVQGHLIRKVTVPLETGKMWISSPGMKSWTL